MENHNPFELEYKPQSRFIEICTEENNIYILPTIKLFYENTPYGKLNYMYLEFSWIKWSLGIRIKK
jgi:hypothetical protein